MNLFHAAVFGIVEGASEFLPISSTGHLILAARLMGLAQTEFLKSFEIAIQLGAILSVLVLYWNSFAIRPEILKRVLAAFLPTAVLGFILYKFIKKFLIGNEHVVLISLFAGGVFLILFEKLHRAEAGAIRDISELPYAKAVGIGIFQALAVIPGVSRAAATIVGGLLFGVERKTIVEFSFLLAVPTMLAATLLDLMKNANAFSPDQFEMLAAGFVVSFAVAILCIKGFLKFIKTHTFIPFGIYRIAAALLFWFAVKN